MYDKARRGESMELSPRSISIFQFDIERSLDDRYTGHIKQHIFLPVEVARFNVGKWKIMCFHVRFSQAKFNFSGYML